MKIVYSYFWIVEISLRKSKSLKRDRIQETLNETLAYLLLTSSKCFHKEPGKIFLSSGGNTVLLLHDIIIIFIAIIIIIIIIIASCFYCILLHIYVLMTLIIDRNRSNNKIK